ncbi:hypothetical protein PQ469_04905 [Mucilaginibacter sp. KACC 22773]|nr:hypothetical protein [Mucilaginibacter sp. KACC 22773]WDF79341.1 hypothetical protein PQ469_04905 [Mucilaginibacter sp. KACC 22773]
MITHNKARQGNTNKGEVPSSALDSMNLGAMSGLISLAKSNEPKQDV